jgi:hypothetical protein
MGQPTQSITLTAIFSETIYTELNSISVLNQSTDALSIINMDDTSSMNRILLNEGQSVTITSSTGFVLPTLKLNSAGSVFASIITT